jgi:hypothetical protein
MLEAPALAALPSLSKFRTCIRSAKTQSKRYAHQQAAEKLNILTMSIRSVIPEGAKRLSGIQ